MIKFSELIKTKISSCSKCLSISYALPCQIDVSIGAYLKNFGKPEYPLNSINFLCINFDNGFKIEARLKSKIIKFTIPKKFENSNLNELRKKIEFENSLKKWMEFKLKINIIKEA